jgi:hypothetical protein
LPSAFLSSFGFKGNVCQVLSQAHPPILPDQKLLDVQDPMSIHVRSHYFYSCTEGLYRSCETELRRRDDGIELDWGGDLELEYKSDAAIGTVRDPITYLRLSNTQGVLRSPVIFFFESVL